MAVYRIITAFYDGVKAALPEQDCLRVENLCGKIYVRKFTCESLCGNVYV